jgi:hypothetical protein
MKKLKSYSRLTLVFSVLLIFILNLFACALVRVKTYDETVSQWKSYEDLVKWMEKDFSFDRERYKKFEGTLPIPRTPEETLQLKSGIYIDAAMFLKESLNRINPSYKAQIVVITVRPNVRLRKRVNSSSWITGPLIRRSLVFMGRINHLRNIRDSTKSTIQKRGVWRELDTCPEMLVNVKKSEIGVRPSNITYLCIIIKFIKNPRF